MRSDCGPPSSSTRILALAHAKYGILLLARPRTVLALVRDDPADAGARGFVRLLGIRHLSEGVALALYPSERVLGFAAATDLAHGASLPLLARRLVAHRRALAINGATALSFAGLSLAQLLRHRAYVA